ncbi:Axonemal dynein light chain domain-containing protein [Schistosoma japonicum]|nr:Axonemal dynein light chain domain-containing protein [Schistosoma japonicum]
MINIKQDQCHKCLFQIVHLYWIIRFVKYISLIYRLGITVVKRLNQENIDGYHDRKKVLFRLNSFNFYAEKWIEYLQGIEKFNVTETFKNVKVYLNTHSSSKAYTDISKQSIIRYLQTKDWTIRESLLADIHDGQPVENTNDKEFTIDLSKHLLQTNLASSALLKQYEYTQLIGKIETETIEYEKETVLIEKQWIHLCNTIEFLQQQLNVKQDELKSLEDILHVKTEVIDEQL